MRIGIPREIKIMEGRVGLIPAACAELVGAGHEVIVETQAGLLSGYTDACYLAAGAKILSTAADVYAAAELIVKVKEPISDDLAHLRARHILFSYLHLAAQPELMKHLQAIGLTAIAFETVEENGGLPLLVPMSDIAGRLAVHIGTHLLHQPQGGKGVLLGGLPAAARGRVVVLGAGTAGGSAVAVAAALGAEVVVFDRVREKLAGMRALGHNVTALYAYKDSVSAALRTADLVIGAVLVPGRRAPHILSMDQVRLLQTGSVVIDISVDQGGCIETTRATDYAQPTYVWEGIVHFAVTNIPGAVPRTASEALSAAVLPYVQHLAGAGWEQHASLRAGVNVHAGKVMHPALLTHDAAP